MKKPIVFFILLLVSAVSFSQSVAEEDTDGISRTINYFFNRIGQNAPVYNGSAYPGYGQKILGSPFFGSDQLESGTLFYDGVLYRNIQMAYDVAGDCVIIKDYFNADLLIKLVNEKIDYFIINDHFFINSNGRSNDERSNGFFDRVYNGKHVVWVKRRKQIEDKPLDEKEKSAFVDYNYYYIKRGAQLVPVNNLPGLLKVFADKKAVIKKHLRDQQLKFKKKPEKTIIEAARYYDSLAS